MKYIKQIVLDDAITLDIDEPQGCTLILGRVSYYKEELRPFRVNISTISSGDRTFISTEAFLFATMEQEAELYAKPLKERDRIIMIEGSVEADVGITATNEFRAWLRGDESKLDPLIETMDAKSFRSAIGGFVWGSLMSTAAHHRHAFGIRQTPNELARIAF